MQRKTAPQGYWHAYKSLRMYCLALAARAYINHEDLLYALATKATAT
jgi:hypothetical protein